ncbi:MAG: amidohydrolase family protein, partial [Campylobacterota bacterium]|nr:amidohydrolase family protein [Campylobacterota bacterium]
LGAEISSNPFYVHVLGEQYSKVGVGPERSEVMARGRTVLNAGAKLSFHSDSPMAPARPMLLAWAAVNRLGLSGEKVLGAEEKVSSLEAFRAITIDAAHAIRKETQMGSIDIGKYANFTIFDENPLKADPKMLKDLNIWGTVFEGKIYPIKKQAKGRIVSANIKKRVALQNQNSHEHTHNHEHKHHGDACTTNQMLQAVAHMYVK